MIKLSQHIQQAHGGNVSAFARSVNATRPTVYRWINSGAIWHAGRVWDPVTEGVELVSTSEVQVADIPKLVGALIRKVFDNEASFLAEFDPLTALSREVHCFYMAGERCYAEFRHCDYPQLEPSKITIRTADFMAWLQGVEP